MPSTSWREAKYDEVRVPRLPVVEIDAEPSHILTANIPV
jgi:hypothetical protein